jgi:hypothetical protein
MNDYANIVRIIKELKEVVQRESKRHMMDTHLDSTLHDLIAYEIIPVLEEQLDYDPTPQHLYDNTGGEPAISNSEAHAQAWDQHQKLHT